MRNPRATIAGFLAGAALVPCVAAADCSVSFSPTQAISFGGGVYPLSISGDPTFPSSLSWATAGYDGVSQYIVSVEPNYSPSARAGTIPAYSSSTHQACGVVTVTQPGDPSSLPAPPVCGSSHPGTTVPSSYVETTYAKLMAGLQAIEPQSLAKIVATYKNGGSVSQLITDLGQAITVGVSSTLSRIGGVITSLATGALDPDVWNGVKALYDAANEANPNTCGLWNTNERRLLNQLDGETTVPPQSRQGPTSQYNTQVSSGTPVPLLTTISSEFDYVAGTGQFFTSVILPYTSGPATVRGDEIAK